MRATELRSAGPGAPAAIASRLHLAGLLLILFGIAAAGFMAQHHASTPGAPAAAGQLADHSKAIHVYFVALVMDWALFFYCYAGVRRQGGKLATLSAGRWISARALLMDVAIAIPFWGVWEGVAYGVHWLLEQLHPEVAAASVQSLLPRSAVEIILWVLVCATAGFCEEIAFRGYLQTQFHAFSGSLIAAVLLQAAVFGIAHGYQGWKNATVIMALGVLFGGLAAWRRNLRANIITHAWADLWGGWLKFVVLH